MKQVLPPHCLVVWNTTMPVSDKIKGGFMLQQLQFMNEVIRSDIVIANFAAHKAAAAENFDVLDLHFRFRHMINHRKADGLHWDARMHRFITNQLLMHVCGAWQIHPPHIQIPPYGKGDQTIMPRSDYNRRCPSPKSRSQIKRPSSTHSQPPDNRDCRPSREQIPPTLGPRRGRPMHSSDKYSQRSSRDHDVRRPWNDGVRQNLNWQERRPSTSTDWQNCGARGASDWQLTGQPGPPNFQVNFSSDLNGNNIFSAPASIHEVQQYYKPQTNAPVYKQSRRNAGPYSWSR